MELVQRVIVAMLIHLSGSGENCEASYNHRVDALPKLTKETIALSIGPRTPAARADFDTVTASSLAVKRATICCARECTLDVMHFMRHGHASSRRAPIQLIPSFSNSRLGHIGVALADTHPAIARKCVFSWHPCSELTCRKCFLLDVEARWPRDAACNGKHGQLQDHVHGTVSEFGH